MNKAKGIEITRADITNPKSDDVAVEDLSIDEGTGDCEQFCSDYEEFADEYVAFMKKYKSNPSDPSILSEYSDMISKAAEMQESSTDCSADVNVAARISKALARIAKAALVRLKFMFRAMIFWSKNNAKHLRKLSSWRPNL